MDARHTQPNLQFYLIMPIQRIPRYKMLLDELLKHTASDHVDYDDLKVAVEEMKLRACEINERVRQRLFYISLICVETAAGE